MASGFRFQGTDLDSVFAPRYSGWPEASATGFEIAGYGDINQRYAPLSTGSAAANTDFRISTLADLATVFAGFGTTGVQVATQPGAVSGSAAAGNPAGTVTSNTTTCAATKGSGSYTCVWHIASGSGVSFTNPTGFTTAVTGSVPSGQTITGTMYATLSDGYTSVNTSTASWSLHNTTPPITVIPYTVSDTETLPTNAGAAILFNPDGTESYQLSFHSPVAIGYWDPSGDGVNYDVMATLVSGTAPNTPGLDTLNTWFQVTASQGWSITNSAGDGSTLTGVISVSIRLHSTGIVQSTGNISLNARSKSSGP